MRELVVIFEGIDDMNRPIFINPQTLGRYGDTDNLFNLYCTEQEVIANKALAATPKNNDFFIDM